MRKITLISTTFLLLLTFSLQAQFLGMIAEAGYGFGRTKVKPFTFNNSLTGTGNNTSISTTDGAKAIAPVSYPYIAMEAYGKNILFQMSFGFGLKKKMKQYEGIKSKDRDGFSMRLAGGFYIKEKIGIMAGVHLQHLSAQYEGGQNGIRSVNSMASDTGAFYVDAVGGGMFGLNINALYSVNENFLLRATYLNNKIKEKKVELGKAGQVELAAYYSFNDEKTFGVYAKLTIMKRRMSSTESSQSVIIPEYVANSTWLNIGILFPGDILSSREYSSGRITVD